jgi:membrane-associated phospholipid phosphatase
MNITSRQTYRPERLEVGASLEVARWRDHPLVKAAASASQIADQPPMMTLAAAALAIGLLRGDRRMSEAAARVLAGVIATTQLKSQVKRMVTRTRPNTVLDGNRYERKLGGEDAGPVNSFPSGHTGDAVAAARALARVYPEFSGLWWGAAALIGLAQLPSGAHYPTDVAAGAVVGLIGESVGSLAVDAILRRIP